MRDKVILFDLDGTLIDSTSAICESFCETLKYFKQPAKTYENIVPLIGHTLEDIFITLGITEELLSSCVEFYKEYYGKIGRIKTKMLPFAIDAIQEAYKIAHLGIVTTKTRSASSILLEYFEVLKYFEVIIGREDVEKPKPHPEPILKAIEFFNQNKEKTYMIGDTILDIQSAREAGVFPIAVSSGYVSESLLKKQKCKVFAHVLDAVLFIGNVSE